jgi:hypothetical protein
MKQTPLFQDVYHHSGNHEAALPHKHLQHHFMRIKEKLGPPLYHSFPEHAESSPDRRTSSRDQQLRPSQTSLQLQLQLLFN